MTATITPACRVPFARAEISEDACAAAVRVLRSGWITMGDEVARFEDEIAHLAGSSNAVAVSSCTAALEISLRALGLRIGSQVLVPTMTFCGAVHAIVHAGYRPVLVDVDPATAMVTDETVAHAATRAGGIDAMMVLHFAGHPAPVATLAEAARLPLSRVIEDAAHAIGARWGGQPIGAISAATCFSFYATKNLPIGEGGMITTDDDKLASYARKSRLHGMSTDAWSRYLPGANWRYSVELDGLKANMTDVQAAIGRAQLRHFAAWQERREQIARQYTSRLAGVDGLVLPRWPVSGTHAWHLYVVQTASRLGVRRDRFITYMRRAGIECSVHFVPAHRHPYFRRALRIEGTALPGADQAAERMCSLPLYPSLTDSQVDEVCNAVETIKSTCPVPSGRAQESVA